MALELQVLGLSVLLAMVQLLLFAVPANREVGTVWLAGPRDGEMPAPLSARTARLQRAFQNHIEGLAFFTPAVVVVVLGGASSGFTGAAAVVYLLARIAYLPCYWAGIPWLRSAVWGVAMGATLAMLLAALLGGPVAEAGGSAGAGG
ncbi:MAG: MAPEG family protein [Pseudomonadota bacterium]